MSHIKRVIEESDYYIVIIKARYGSTDSDGISYTEREFNNATQLGRPTLAFIYKDRDGLTVRELDKEIAKQERLNRFIAQLEDKKIVKYWLSKEELREIIKDSIYDLSRRRPGVGWIIRGDQAIDPRIVNELESVRRERDSLKEVLAKLKKESAVIDTAALDFVMRIDYSDGDELVSFIDISAYSLFKIITVHWYSKVKSLYIVVDEPTIYEAIASYINETTNIDGQYRKILLSYKSMDEVKARFERIGLVEIIKDERVKYERRKAPIGDDELSQIRWKMTRAGIELAAARPERETGS